MCFFMSWHRFIDEHRYDVFVDKLRVDSFPRHSWWSLVTALTMATGHLQIFLTYSAINTNLDTFGSWGASYFIIFPISPSSDAIGSYSHISFDLSAYYLLTTNHVYLFAYVYMSSNRITAFWPFQFGFNLSTAQNNWNSAFEQRHLACNVLNSRNRILACYKFTWKSIQFRTTTSWFPVMVNMMFYF